jgi:hypothetical protein
MVALGLRPNYWDGYFAGRAGAPGRGVPAEVLHALFYNFADGEVARHIPRVWDVCSPKDAVAARQRERRRAAADARRPGRRSWDGRTADVLATAAAGAPTEGRPMSGLPFGRSEGVAPTGFEPALPP